MKYALVDSSNIVQNVINYTGSGYIPPSGLTTQQVNDWVQIGQNINTTDPSLNIPILTPAQQASNAISAGVVITSTGTPTLNGAYPVNATIQQQINAVVTYILLNNTFPGGISQLPWPDASGVMHVFPNTTSFNVFASATANYVAQASIFGSSNGTIGSIPSNQITIP